MIPPLQLHPASLGLAVSGPWTVLLFVLLAVAALLVAHRAYTGTQPPVGGTRRGVLIALRALVLLLLLFLLAEPILHRREARTTPPGVLLLVDDSGSMGIEDDTGTARRVTAEHLRSEMAARLRSRSEDVEIFQAEGARRLRRPGEQEEAEGTNLPVLLLSSAQRHLEDNLQAIVLFSDGVDTDQDLPSLAGLNVPVMTVAVGDTAGPVDLRLDRVRYPTLAYRGEEIEIQAEVVVEDPRPGSARVRRIGPAGVDSVEVRWPAGGGRLPVSFVVPADSLGLRRHRLVVAARPEEGLTANNAVQVGFEVRKERLHVVLLQSRPGWDFHFLRRRLARDPRFRSEGVYRSPEGWRVAGADSTWIPPADAAAAEGVDAWVVGSLEDLAELSRLAPGLSASVEAGSGLLVLFGEARRRTPPPLPAEANRLLPVVLTSQARWEKGQYRAQATALGRQHPVLALPDRSDDGLASLPPLWEVVRGLALREDADVLLQAQSGDGSWPLLVLGKRGRGTVAAFTGAPLWSWSFWRLGAQGGGETYEALVGNLLYQLAEGGGDGRLRLILPRNVLARGEDAVLRAVALDPRQQPDDAGDVWLEWRSAATAAADSNAAPEGRSRMEVDPRTPGGRRLSLPPLPAGRYQLRVAKEEGEGRLVSPWQSLVIDPYSVEYQEPGVDRASLQRIARTTGGRLLDGPERASWADEVPLREQRTVRTSRFALWSSLRLFLPFLLLLSLEWLLRKRWGLI